MITSILAFLGESAVLGYFIFLVLLLIYFLPSIVGYNRKNFGAIFLLNLLLGWTFIGWVVALVWAATYESAQQKMPNNTPSQSSSVDEIIKLTSLRNTGSITEAEYQRAKEKILNG